ncbi:hypothetical protein B2M20_11625 [Nitrobacter vulgaris]|uniref:Uncharacterized protein n=2 Tax=Nitrobacter vulgaris TaxID=29421 RepID=A0A1V4HXY9_NITVU|nr:hypothetical protein B2M20_11625 [Nitrobacter vulgaris]
MRAIGKLDPAALTLRQNAYVFSYLADAVMEMAKRKDHFSPPYNYVREDFYKREIFYLQDLGKRRQYSPALYEWMKMARDKFAGELQLEQDFQKGLREWSDMTIEERKEFLREQIRAQIKSFSKHGVEFLVPPISFEKLSGDSYAQFRYLMTTRGPEDTDIVLHTKLLNWRRALRPLAYAFHEVTHAVTWQLARAVTEGTIAPGHPLYKDALQRKISIHASAAFPGKVESLSLQCPEEDIAYTSQFRFEERLSEQIRAANRTARNARPTL